MLRKLLKDNNAQLQALIPAAIVITVLVVLFTIIPIIGYNVDQSWTPPTASGAAGVQWNSANVNGSQSMTNATELWSTNSPLLSLAVLIGIIFIAIGTLLKGRGIGGGGGGL